MLVNCYEKDTPLPMFLHRKKSISPAKYAIKIESHRIREKAELCHQHKNIIERMLTVGITALMEDYPSNREATEGGESVKFIGKNTL